MNDKILDLNLVFSTPIWGFLVKDYTKLNINMREYIKELQKSNPYLAKLFFNIFLALIIAKAFGLFFFKAPHI